MLWDGINQFLCRRVPPFVLGFLEGGGERDTGDLGPNIPSNAPIARGESIRVGEDENGFVRGNGVLTDL